MKPLRRTTLYTEQKQDDVRLDQLERRITPNECCLMPTYYTEGANHDLEEGIAYGTGILWPTSANFEGLADSMTHANDETDGTGTFYFFDDEVAQTYGGPRQFSYQFGIRLQGADIDAAGTLTMWVLCPVSLGGTEQEYIWYGDELAQKAAELSPTFWMTGEVTQTQANTFYDPDTAIRNGAWIMGAVNQECGVGGADVTMTAMWSKFVSLGGIETVASYP